VYGQKPSLPEIESHELSSTFTTVVVVKFCKDEKRIGKIAKFDLPPTDLLTDHHKTLQRWLYPGCTWSFFMLIVQ